MGVGETKWTKSWREMLFCHLVAILGITLSSLAGKGNGRFLGGLRLCQGSGSLILDWMGCCGVGPPPGARLFVSSNVCAP